MIYTVNYLLMTCTLHKVLVSLGMSRRTTYLLHVLSKEVALGYSGV